MAKRDYYDILGVPRNADEEQIKRAYRRLARKYHPDVNKQPGAVERFKEVQEAYQVLSDKNKRAAYDQFGHVGVGMGAGPGGQWSRGPGGSRVYYSTSGSGGGFDFDLGDIGFGGSMQDILDQIFGRRTGGRRARTGAPPSKGQDIEQPVTLTFEQAVWGTTLRLQVGRPDGRGQIVQETLDVKIPPGVHEGSRIRLRGKGQAGTGGPAGDLYIVVHVKDHPYFRRKGNDIYLDVPITVSEAILGAKVKMPTIDGPTTVTIPPGTSSGQKLRLRGKGAPDPKTHVRGDQYAVIKVVVPKQVDQKLAEAVRQLDKGGDDLRKALNWAV